MRRYPSNSNRKNEQGLIITLVAVFMASVVIVMAALAIDLTTLYTARSEAQIAADSAALAAARVLANSGMTSGGNLSTAFDTSTAETRAQAVAVRVASKNEVGGKALSGTGNCGAAGISVCFTNDTAPDLSNPHVTVQVSRSDLPTFFLRFWSRQLKVVASATAEAYNPAGLSTGSDPAPPIAPVCVKPWLLPNVDPTQTSNTGTQIFDPATGNIKQPDLLGQGWGAGFAGNPNGLRTYNPANPPFPGRVYPASIGAGAGDFPEPAQALPSCSAGFKPYQLAVAACVSRPIPCGPTSSASINIDTATYATRTGTRSGDTLEAEECLIHYKGSAGDADSMNGGVTPTLPFEFIGGAQNPVVVARRKDVFVSDSIVTIPVYDTGTVLPPPAPPASVTVIGFLQVFLNPQSAALPDPFAPTPPPHEIPAVIINQIGCGTDSTGTAVYGNGPSAVPVRLITPP